MKKNRWVSIIKAPLFLAFLIGTEFVLIFLVYLIPTETRMRQHLNDAIPFYENTGDYPCYTSSHYRGTIEDGYTDQLMLSMAAYSFQGSVLQECLLNHYIQSDHSADALRLTVGDSGTLGLQKRIIMYGRYWNGYLVFLKPLLYFFSVDTIRLLNIFICLIATTVFLFSLYHYFGVPSFLGGILVISFLNPVTVSLSLTYMADYLLMIFTSLCVMSRRTNTHGMIYLLAGNLCAYFDLLTYPLVTLGIPLILCLIKSLESDKTIRRHFSLVGNTLLYSIIWFISYVATWGGKWFIANLVTRENVVEDALGEVALRTSSFHDNGNKLTAIDTWFNNCAVFFKPPYIILTVSLIACVVVYFNFGNARKHIQICSILPFVVICCLPFIWYSLTINHSYEHVIFTHRDLAVTIGAGWGILVIIISVFSERIQRFCRKQAEK